MSLSADWLKSSLCTEASLGRPDFQAWVRQLDEEPGLMHRKIWEWAFICQALAERGMLAPGRRGLGFAVGQEALASVFAARGAHILATDMATDEAARKGWIETKQHADNLAALNKRKLCDPEVMRERVEFRFVDMRDIPRDLHGGFDFTWSACALEHLGSLEAGMQFVSDSLACLKPGGVAVHTTEFNVTSDEETVEQGETVLYRRRDLHALAQRLRDAGHHIELDLRLGEGLADGHIDLPPYTHRPHLKLQLERYVITSAALVVTRAQPWWSPRRWLGR